MFKPQCCYVLLMLLTVEVLIIYDIMIGGSGLCNLKISD